MKSTLDFIRTTLIGGVMFLLPLLLIMFIGKHGLALAMGLAKPLAALIPDSVAGGAASETLVAVLGLLLLAFMFGLFARTVVGQRFFAWLESGFVGSLPQFKFARGLAENFGTDGGQTVEVVLVPADAGWAIGLIFERDPEANWVSVFLPGAPQWSAGSVVFAEVANIRPTNLTFIQVMQIQRKLGTGAGPALEALANFRD